jgi:SnoaL-like domain
VSQENVDLIRALIPPPEMDLVSLFRDETRFAQTSAAVEPLLDPGIESVAVWRGGATYAGIDGFRRMWLDWLEPWAAYHSRADELIDAGDRVVVLVRDRARRDDTEAEVELISGSVWQLRDGRIIRVEFCANRRQALEAAGLRE